MTSLDGYEIEINKIPHDADEFDDCACRTAPWPGRPYVNPEKFPGTEENRRIAHGLALQAWAALNAEGSES